MSAKLKSSGFSFSPWPQPDVTAATPAQKGLIAHARLASWSKANPMRSAGLPAEPQRHHRQHKCRMTQRSKFKAPSEPKAIPGPQDIGCTMRSRRTCIKTRRPPAHKQEILRRAATRIVLPASPASSWSAHACPNKSGAYCKPQWKGRMLTCHVRVQS